jgi:hypothetical protein
LSAPYADSARVAIADRSGGELALEKLRGDAPSSEKDTGSSQLQKELQGIAKMDKKDTMKHENNLTTH